MADANIRINIDDASLGQLNSELERLNQEIQDVPRNSKEFEKLSASIRKLKGEVEKTEVAFNAIDPAGLAGELGALGAAVGAVGVAFSSFGGDNEELQAALEKTNAIIGLAAVAEQVANVTRKESQVRLAATTVATNLASAAQAAYTAVIGTSTGALKLFRLALVSTGIGAIVVAVGLLIANWDKLTSAVTNFVDKSEGLTKLFDFIRNIIPAVTGAIKAFFTQFTEIAGSIGKILKGIFTLDLDAIKEGVNQATTILKEGAVNGIKEAEAERRKQAEIERRENLQGELDYQAKVLAAQGAGYKEQYDAKRKALENQLELTRLANGEESQEYKDLYVELLKLNTDYNNKVEQEENKATQDRIKRAQERRKALLAAELGLVNTRNEVLNLDYEERLKVIDANETAERRTIQETAKSRQEIQERSATADLKFGAERVRLVQEIEQKQLEELQKGTEEQLAELQRRAELVGDDAAAARIQQQIQDIQTAAAADNARITNEAKARLKALLEEGKVSQEIYAQALAEIEALGTQAATELTKATGEAATGAAQTTSDTLTGILEDELAGKIAAIKTLIAQENLKILQSEEGAAESSLANIAKFEQDILELKKQNAQARADAAKEGSREEAEALQEVAELTVEIEKKKQEEIDRTSETFEEQAQGLLESAENIAQYADLYLDAFGSIIAFNEAKLGALESQNQRELDAVTARYDAEVEAAEAAGRSTVEIEARKESELARIQAQAARKEADLRIKIAKQNFALTVGQSVANASLAIIRAFAELGPIGGSIAAAAIGTTTGFEIAAAKTARDQAIAEARAAAGQVSAQIDSRTTFAEGGYVSGPGTGTSDSIPARLSNGEYVINAASTARFLPLLEQINNTPRNFANGGLATSGPDLTEILARIERRLATPPKAYVVATEIQDGLDTEEYLQRRATLT